MSWDGDVLLPASILRPPTAQSHPLSSPFSCTPTPPGELERGVRRALRSVGLGRGEPSGGALSRRANEPEVFDVMRTAVQGAYCPSINAPTSQSLLNYILLALVYGSILIYRRQPLTTKWYYYLILGIIDVEANYIVVKSYQYTSLTSVMLLDCWSIPCVIVLTWIFLKTKYGLRKFIGVGVCVAGLILVVFSDVHASDRAKGPKPLMGDLLVIVGSMLYACSNVTEEYLVKNNNRIELMAMLGVFGAVISGIQISILERKELHSIKWNAGAVLPFLGFAVAMFLFYSTVPTVLKICGATMLNLSLLTSDMWAVLIRIFAYHEKVDWMYFVAFGCTAGGILIYSYRSSKEAEDTAQVVGTSDEQCKEGDVEAGMQNPVRSCVAGGNVDQISYKVLPSTGSTSKN